MAMRRQASWRTPLRAVGWACMLLLVMCGGHGGASSDAPEHVGTSAAAIEDVDNTAPIKWWLFDHLSASDVTAKAAQLNARPVDVKVDPVSPYPYTVTYVQNTGAYAKTWWFDADVAPGDYTALINKRGGRLIALKGYDNGCSTTLCGSNTVKLTGIMIANTGADAKSWYWAVGSLSYVLSQQGTNRARLTTLQSFASQGSTQYAAVMIADGTEFTYVANAPPSQVQGIIGSNNKLVDLTYAGNGNYNAVTEFCGNASCQFSWYYGQTYSQVMTNAQTNNMRVLTADAHVGCDGFCYDVIMVPDSIGTDPNTASTKLRGFADLHTHPLANVGFAGTIFYGGVDSNPSDPRGQSLLPHTPDADCQHGGHAYSIERALGHDGSTHDGFNALSNQCGDDIRDYMIHQLQSSLGANDPPGDSDGADDFTWWPAYNDITHQKMWVDWLRRSWANGQRVLVALAVNNKTLADSSEGPGDYASDDETNAYRQITETIRFVNAHGPLASSLGNDNFMEVAYSSSDVQRIVQSGRLAVIVGMEVDALGNFYNSITNDQITHEVNYFYGLGVRYIFPVHILDNAFGGTAIYSGVFDYSNHVETGNWYSSSCYTAPAANDQIDYNLNPAVQGPAFQMAAAEALKDSSLLQPGGIPFVSAALAAPVGGGVLAAADAAALWLTTDNPPSCSAPSGASYKTGSMNTKALTSSGWTAIQDMMKLGMLVDVDHMSQNTMNATMSNVGSMIPGYYPLISGHANIREGGGSERNPTQSQYANIGKFGGMAGIGTQGKRAGAWNQIALDTVAAMGGHGAVALGTDTNGLAQGTPPTVPGMPAGSRPASFFTHETGTACTVNCQHDQQHAFYRDVNGSIVHVFYDNGSSFFNQGSAYQSTETWTGNPSAKVANAPLAAGDPTGFFSTQGMEQHVFYRDVNNAIQHVFWDPTNGMKLESWAHDSGGSSFGPAAAGEPTGLYDPDFNQQHIFYRDFSGNIQHVYYDPAGGRGVVPDTFTWGSNAVGTPATMYSFEPNSACTSDCVHKIQHVFFRDTSNRIMHSYFDENTDSFNGPEVWAGAGAGTAAPAAAGDPVAFYTANLEQQHLFYRDFGGNIQHVFYDNHGKNINYDTTPWGTGAVGVPAGFESASPGPQPANAPPDLQEHVFFRNASNQMVHVYYDEPTATLSAPEVWATNAGGDPSTLVDSSSDLQQKVFYRDLSGNLENSYYNGTSLTKAQLWAGCDDPVCSTPITYDSNFLRSSQGTKTWDYNYQGVAHYGLIPDFFRSVQTLPTGSDLYNYNVMWGAEAFYEMWKKAEGQASKVQSASPSAFGGMNAKGQSLVIAIGTSGAVYARPNQGGVWQTPVELTPTGFAPVNGSVAAGQETSSQNSAFVVGNDGAVYTVGESNGGAWLGPTALTATGFATPGTPLATINQGGQLGVAVVDTSGKVNIIWWNPLLGWLGPVAITPASYATPTSFLAFGTRATGEIDLFSVGTDGSLKYMAFNLGVWSGPYTLTVTNFAPPGAPVAAAQDLHGFLNAFVVGNDGAIYTKWDATPLWSGPTAISATGFAQLGSSLSALTFAGHALDLFVVDPSGALDVFANAGVSWQGPTTITSPGIAQPGASVGSSMEGTQAAAFAITMNGIVESTNSGSNWSTPVSLP
jgi:microsomal dipeptidase-like Zn-dependent dipeptidase